MAEPILPDLPQRLAQFQRKYSGQAQDPNDVLYPALRAASPGATSALQRLDLQRIGRGQDPYTATESAYGLTAATQQRAVTPEPDQGFFSDLISNTGDLVRGLNPFVLVPALYQEAKLLPSALQALPDTFSASSSPLEAVSNIANLPGFRFIPGSYVAGAYGDPYTDMATGREVVPGGTEQLIDNPLFTALDVLPYASKAAKLTPAYKSVTEALETQARILGAPAPRAPRPLPTVLRNLGGSVDEVSDLRRALIDQGKIPERGMGALDPSMPVRGPVITPNRVGRALDTASQRFGSTTPGRWLADLRSPYARTVAERGVFGASYLTDAERGASLDPTAARIFYDGSNEMRALSDQLDQARIPEIHRAVVTGDDAFLNTLSAPERAYVDRYTQLNEELRSYAVSEGQKLYNAPRGRGRPNQKQATNVFGLLEVPFAHGLETYSYAEGAKILDARLRRDAAQFFTDKLAEVRGGNFTHYTPESIQAELLAALDNASRFKTAELHQAVRLSLLSAQAAGFDTFRLLADWNRRKPGSGAIDSFRARVADPSFTANLKQVARPTAQQVIADTLTTITPLRTRPLYTTLHDALTRGDIGAARAAVRRLAQSKVHVPAFDVTKLRSALDEVNAVNRAADRVERLGLGPKSLSKLDKKVANLERKSVPARWDDALRVEANRNIVTQIADLQSQGKLTPEQASTAIDALGDNLIARVESTLADADPAYASIINAAVRDAKESWQQLAASGLEPRFVHRVTETQAQRMANPVIFDMPNMTPRSMRSRLWDPAPAVPDLAISLSHQAFDILNARASARYAEEMAQWYGVRGDELWRRYEDRGRATAARTGESVDQAIQRLVERDYTPYNPAQLLRGKKPKGQTLQVSNSANQILVPRTVASTLERVRQIEPSSFQSAISKPMRVFRTSLLPLSPRWHLYNIVGGGIMAGSTASPRIVTTFADAFRMARNEGEMLGKIESPTGMTALPPGGHIRAHNEWFESARRSPHARVGVAHSFAAGRTLSRWFGDVIEKSYAANQFVDNFYRAAAYLDGEKSALTRGMTREEAIDAGIQSAREALQSWDRLTPVERSGMRVLFPFYSWCVDRDTEALTKRGWVDGDSITTDDEVLSMDPATGQLHWSSIKSIYHNPDYSGPMHRMVSGQMDALVTPGHKFATTDGELVPSDKLRQKHTIRTMGTAVDGPDIYSDAFVEVMGWAVTEGHWKINRSGNVTTIEISQLNTGPHVDRIRLALKRSGARWHEYLAGVDHRIRYFGVTGQVAQDIVRLAPRRVMTHDFILSLSPPQRLTLIDTMIAADGSVATRGKGDRPTFVQKCDEASDRFEMLCALSGIQTNRRKHAGCNVITLKSTTTAQVRSLRGFQPTNPALGPNPSRRPTVHYDGLVWCPETEYGTWVCRRGGKVYVTGNTSHLFRFVMQYPHDHPVRLAITARIAETELTDMQSGLPQKFQSMFTPFGIDADGNTTAIITDGINPFKDVTNWALLAGFLSGQQGGNLAAVTSGLNPLISTTLEVAGFDTFRGTPDLYPDLTYDPATGQLTSLSNGVLPIALINNLIPQTELLTNAAGLNAEFKALAERDPEAASRQMLSNMGLPSSLVRNLNINEEAIKAEVQRYTQMQNTRAEALRTGNLGLLDQYPVLSSYRSQVEAVMASGGGGQFQPSTNATYAAAANAAQVRELGNEGTGMDLLGLLTPG